MSQNLTSSLLSGETRAPEIPAHGRRNFLKGCSAALMLGGLSLAGSSASAAAKNNLASGVLVEEAIPEVRASPVLTAPQPFFRKVDHLTLDDFSPHLGKTFALHALNQQDGTLVPLALTLEDAQSLPFARLQGGDAPQQSFNLIFDGPLDVPLSQGTFDLKHPEKGSILVFLVPIGQSDKTRRYEAVFNRVS